MQQQFVFDILNPIINPSKWDPSRSFVNLWIAFRDPTTGRRVTGSIQTGAPNVVGLAACKGHRFSAPMSAVKVVVPTEPDGSPMISESTGQVIRNVEITDDVTFDYVGIATPPEVNIRGLPAALAEAHAALAKSAAPATPAAPAAAPAAPTVA